MFTLAMCLCVSGRGVNLSRADDDEEEENEDDNDDNDDNDVLYYLADRMSSAGSDADAGSSTDEYDYKLSDDD